MHSNLQQSGNCPSEPSAFALLLAGVVVSLRDGLSAFGEVARETPSCEVRCSPFGVLAVSAFPPDPKPAPFVEDSRPDQAVAVVQE